MSTGGGVRDRIDGLAAAIDAVADLDPAHLPAGVQLDLLKALHPLLCRLDAQLTRVVGVVHTQGSAGQEAAVSTRAWLRSRLHTADGWHLHLDHHTGIVTATDPHGTPLDIVSHPRAQSP